MSAEPETPRGGRVRNKLRSFGRRLWDPVQKRFELLSADLSEARATLARAVIAAVVALFCLQAGLFLGVLFIVLSLGRPDVIRAIGFAALGFLLVSAGTVGWMWWWWRHRPSLFRRTLSRTRKGRAGEKRTRSRRGPA